MAGLSIPIQYSKSGAVSILEIWILPHYFSTWLYIICIGRFEARVEPMYSRMYNPFIKTFLSPLFVPYLDLIWLADQWFEFSEDSSRPSQTVIWQILYDYATGMVLGDLYNNYIVRSITAYQVRSDLIHSILSSIQFILLTLSKHKLDISHTKPYIWHSVSKAVQCPPTGHSFIFNHLFSKQEETSLSSPHHHQLQLRSDPTVAL